jgi:hypothetical protein
MALGAAAMAIFVSLHCDSIGDLGCSPNTGDGCKSNGECCSGVCEQGVCTPVCRDGGACAVSSDCCSGNCSAQVCAP